MITKKTHTYTTSSMSIWSVFFTTPGCVYICDVKNPFPSKKQAFERHRGLMKGKHPVVSVNDHKNLLRVSYVYRETDVYVYRHDNGATPPLAMRAVYDRGGNTCCSAHSRHLQSINQSINQ